ncbi:MAG: PIG-L family deacetylase, partial [Acidobacteriaceae bacterium]|nr:PIG-L family deacetylase [Acidobacteriaceae bacterium]
MRRCQFQCISSTIFRAVVLLVMGVTLRAPVWAQRELSGAAEVKLTLDRLNVTGSVLMIAAHPDDENTAVLAYFARGRKVRTGYLSLTRGEGGQNLIGSQQGDELGVIRTQELLAARRIDGAEQFFTRAIDFGFTKTPAEAFEKWGREKILSDVVWVVRRFRPDVIILRFSGTPRDGHGQHQASAILGKEAFTAAADRNRFPEQLQWVQPWQAKRLLWNVFSFNRDQEKEAEAMKDRIEIDAGDYDPVLGHSYGEIAGMSRSLHKSQGMGAPERKGSQANFFVTIAGDPAKKDPFDGIDLTWDSVPGASEVSRLLAEASHTVDVSHPEKVVPLLLKVEPLLAALHHPVAERKHHDLLDAIRICSGLSLEATADRYAALPGGSFKLTASALDREGRAIELESVSVNGIAKSGPVQPKASAMPKNKPDTVTITANIAADQPYSQPYWLRYPKQGATYTVPNQLEIGLAENPPLLEADFRILMNGQAVEMKQTAIYRYIDRVQGELTRPLVVEPPVAIEMPEQALVFPNPAAKVIEIQVRANAAKQAGSVRLEAPEGWAVKPSSQEFNLTDVGQQVLVPFQVTPPSGDARGAVHAAATVGGQTVTVGTEVISFMHIPTQTLFPAAE